VQRVHDAAEVKERAAQIVAHARKGALELAFDAPEWASGVYCLLDTVFRARAEYATMIRPMLVERLPARPGMRDRAALRFRDLLADVDSMRRDKLEAYAAAALNRQQIAGRLKVAICCEAAAMLSERGLETKRRLLALDARALEDLVCRDLVGIVGFGDALARRLLLELGFAGAVRPDRDVRRYLGRVSGWRPRPNAEDDERARAVLCAAARRLRVTPMRLDVAIRRHEAAPEDTG
jgi:hypothetical protein